MNREDRPEVLSPSTQFWVDIREAVERVFRRETSVITIVRSDGFGTAVVYDPRTKPINATMPKGVRSVLIVLRDTRFTGAPDGGP